MVDQRAPQRCPSWARLASHHHGEAEVQEVVHAKDSLSQAKSMRFKDLRVVTPATVQARAATRDDHVIDVPLAIFREPHLDVLEQREASEVVGH
jgi:hypothetical protein